MVGGLSDRVGPRVIMRSGLVLLAVACLALGLLTAVRSRNLVGLCGLLVLVGVGVALVQTPSATGATRSSAGRSGTALGLFNMTRFAGSAFGAAWVAVIYPCNAPFLLFTGAALLLLSALAVTFLRPDPVPSAAAVLEEVITA